MSNIERGWTAKAVPSVTTALVSIWANYLARERPLRAAVSSEGFSVLRGEPSCFTVSCMCVYIYICI
jgi:hypothetical protein